MENIPSTAAIKSMIKWGNVLVNNDPFLLQQLAKAFDDHAKSYKEACKAVVNSGMRNAAYDMCEELIND